MKRQILACTWAAAVVVGAASNAGAGVWRWGCQGALGNEQITYNRDSLVVTAAKPPGKKIDELIFKDDLAEGTVDTNNGYKNDTQELSFVKTTTFTHKGDPKRTITLIEKSSRLISHRHKLICGRDEDTDIYRKVYSYQRGDEPARDVTMQCMEYQLSTRGGRRGCD